MNRLPLIILTLLCICSCAKNDSPEQMITDARIEFDDGEYNSARRILDRLTSDSALLASMNVRELVFTAELYTLMALQPSDSCTDTDAASAARCLTLAHSISPDSVDFYINSLPTEAAHHLRTISSVSAYLGIPRDSLITNEEPDSVM